jgi:hypothetical protein
MNSIGSNDLMNYLINAIFIKAFKDFKLQAESKPIKFTEHLANLNLVKHLAELIVMHFEATKGLLVIIFAIIVITIKELEQQLMELKQHFMRLIMNFEHLNRLIIMG